MYDERITFASGIFMKTRTYLFYIVVKKNQELSKIIKACPSVSESNLRVIWKSSFY